MSTPMTQVRVTVRLKRAILDPQGRAVEATLHRLGHGSIEGLRVGKIIEFTVPGLPDDVGPLVEQVSHEVLANPVMEDVEISLRLLGAPEVVSELSNESPIEVPEP